MILWLAFVFAKKVNKSLNTTAHCDLTLGLAQFMVWIACEYSRLSLLIAATDVEEPGQMALFSCHGLKCDFKRNVCIINYLYSSNVHNAFSKYNNCTALFVLKNKKSTAKQPVLLCTVKTATCAPWKTNFKGKKTVLPAVKKQNLLPRVILSSIKNNSCSILYFIFVVPNVFKYLLFSVLQFLSVCELH